MLQSLDYSARAAVTEKLFPGLLKLCVKEKKELFDALGKLTDGQYACLIRAALAARPETKEPKNVSAYFLYQMAMDAGVDTAAIERAQQQKAEKRQKSQRERIAGLGKKIERLKNAA